MSGTEYGIRSTDYEPERPDSAPLAEGASSWRSAYVHIPFCAQMCTYCGCSVVVARRQDRADLYLDHLERELNGVRIAPAKQDGKQVGMKVVGIRSGSLLRQLGLRSGDIIFQINGRLGDLVHIQRIHAKQTIESAELERQAFIAQLAADGPNHKAYLDYLVDLNYLTQDQADFILKQSGKEIVEKLTADS